MLKLTRNKKKLQLLYLIIEIMLKYIYKASEIYRQTFQCRTSNKCFQEIETNGLLYSIKDFEFSSVYSFIIQFENFTENKLIEGNE